MSFDDPTSCVACIFFLEMMNCSVSSKSSKFSSSEGSVIDRDRIIIVLEVLGYTGKEKRG
jgi:hypothetical protein